MRILVSLSLAVALHAGSALAQDDDSSAMTAESYPAPVAASDGVVLRVPVDASGQEIAARAELRVTDASDQGTSGLPLAFDQGTEVVPEAVLGEGEDSDSSTFGTCGWSSWSVQPTYVTYAPRYTYYSSTWTYSYSSTYTYVSSSGRYNYYYYQRSERYYYGSSVSWTHVW